MGRRLGLARTQPRGKNRAEKKKWGHQPLPQPSVIGTTQPQIDITLGFIFLNRHTIPQSPICLPRRSPPLPRRTSPSVPPFAKVSSLLLLILNCTIANIVR